MFDFICSLYESLASQKSFWYMNAGLLVMMLGGNSEAHAKLYKFISMGFCILSILSLLHVF